VLLLDRRDYILDGASIPMSASALARTVLVASTSLSLASLTPPSAFSTGILS